MTFLVVALLWAVAIGVVRRYAVTRARDGRISLLTASVMMALVWGIAPILLQVTGAINADLLFVSGWAVVNFLVALVAARVLLSLFLPKRPPGSEVGKTK